MSRTCDYSMNAYQKDGKFDAERFAATVIGKNYLHDDFRSLLGINRFDNVTWFNKEAFESALFCGKLLFVLEGDSAFGAMPTGAASMPWLDRAARIAEISEALEKAKAASGYRLDSLINMLGAPSLEGPSLEGSSLEESVTAKTVSKKIKSNKRKKE